MKTLFAGIGLVLALVAGSVQAIPTLRFTGDINFNSGALSVNSTLTAASDITPPLASTTGSNLSLSATLDHVSSDSFRTFGYFTGATMTVTDGNATTLLNGNFSQLLMKGGNGLDGGSLTGTFNATGGSLASQFNPGNLVAFEFNLNTTFSPTMFYANGESQSFSGDSGGYINGQNASVPEPGILALLALGVVLIGFARKQTGTNR